MVPSEGAPRQALRAGPGAPAPHRMHAYALCHLSSAQHLGRGRHFSSSLQTIFTYSAARRIGVVPPPRNQTPWKIFTDLSFPLEITGEQGESLQPERERDAKLSPANSCPLGSSGPHSPAQVRRRRDSRRGPSLLTSRGPHLLTCSRSPGPAAFSRGSAKGLWGRDGSRGPPPRRALSPGPRARAPGPATPPAGGAGRGALRGLRRALPLRAPPRPAAPPRRREALAPGGRARARAAPSPPPPPRPGRGRARSGDVKGRAVAAPPRALVKKKKKRGSET